MGCSTSSTKDNINIKPVAQIPIQTEAVHLVAEEEKKINSRRLSQPIKLPPIVPRNITIDANKDEYNGHKRTISSQSVTNPQTDRSHRRSMSHRKSDIRRSQCNGVVIVENLKEYLPSDITKENILQMVENALEGSIVEDESQVVRGKTVSRKQVEAIADIVYLRLQDGDDEPEKEQTTPVSSTPVKEEEQKRQNVNRKTKVRYSCINQLFVTVGMRELTPELLRETCFKNKQVTQIQIDNAMKNLSQGMKDVKVLTIELR